MEKPVSQAFDEDELVIRTFLAKVTGYKDILVGRTIRPLIVSSVADDYGKPFTWVISVQGSPPKGTLIVALDMEYSRRTYGIFYIGPGWYRTRRLNEFVYKKLFAAVATFLEKRRIDA